MNVIQVNFTKSQTDHWTPLELDAVTSIVVHHIAKKTASVDEINGWHLYDNKWLGGFGYNEYITKSGAVYMGRGDHVGAQCRGYNDTSYGIACEGDYEHELFMPVAQFKSLVERCKYHKARLNNYVGTFPHSYFAGTKCPGKHFPLTQLLAELEKPEVDEGFVNCVNMLHKQDVITSPEYWIKSKDYKHEYVVQLIKNAAIRIYQITDV